MITTQKEEDETPKKAMDHSPVLVKSRKFPVLNLRKHDVVQHVGGWFGFKPNQSAEDVKVADLTTQYEGDTTASVCLLCFFRNAS